MKQYQCLPARHTLAQMFTARVAETPQAIAYIEYDRQRGSWTSCTWQAMQEKAGHIQGLLQQLGLQAGDRIGLMARGSTYWAGLDLAAAGLGIVTVPLYYRDRAGNVAYVAQRTDMKVLFIGGRSQWDKLTDDSASGPDVGQIFSAEDLQEEGVQSFEAALKNVDPEPYRVECTDAEALATIVFTSGTTGRPRGVLLTHANILSNAAAATLAVPIAPEDRLLSFLPLSHMFERTVGYYAPMLHGATVAFARSVRTLLLDLRQQPPTILVSVPRVYEKLYETLTSRASLSRLPGRILLGLAQQAGRSHLIGGRFLWGWLPRLLIGRQVRQALGGRLRFAITGGAAMPKKIAHFMAGIGIPLLQGYGLTETSPVLSVNRLNDVRADTVGPLIEGVEARLSDTQELLVKGPGVTQGYWDDSEATREVLDDEGWLHTGDLVAFEDGHLRIIGRSKEIIVLSNGEKAPPQDLEDALCRDPRIAQAWVTGEGRPFLSAVVVMKSPVSERKLRTKAKWLLRNFPSYARIRRFHVEREPWTVRNGLLTPSLKLCRPALRSKYQTIIAAFYA